MAISLCSWSTSTVTIIIIARIAFQMTIRAYRQFSEWNLLFGGNNWWKGSYWMNGQFTIHITKYFNKIFLVYCQNDFIYSLGLIWSGYMLRWQCHQLLRWRSMEWTMYGRGFSNDFTKRTWFSYLSLHKIPKQQPLLHRILPW